MLPCPHSYLTGSSPWVWRQKARVAPWPRGGGFCPHCSNDLFQRQALRSQVLQRLHISLEFGVQDNISDYSITYPTNKYLLSIYDALAAALVQSVPALTEHCPGCCFFIRGLYRHVPSYIRYSRSSFGQLFRQSFLRVKRNHLYSTILQEHLLCARCRSRTQQGTKQAETLPLWSCHSSVENRQDTICHISRIL